MAVRLEASRPEWLTRPEGVSQALRRGARPEVAVRLEVSMPEVLRGPHLGIMSELLTYLACLAVAWGLSCWPT